MPASNRYRYGARWYDLLSGERLIYRAGRLAAIGAMDLRPGQTVLDVGCGTGLSFEAIATRIGPSGHLVGVDQSAQMLARARRRAADLGCRVTLGTLDVSATHDPGWRLIEENPPDAVLFAYTLSIMPAWPCAWKQILDRVSPGTRIVVLDMAVPTGGGRPAQWAARGAAWLGGADLQSHPWQAMPGSTVGTTSMTLRAGHVVVTTGIRRPAE